VAKCSLGLAWVICTLALASCVSSEELRREDKATCARGTAFTLALTPLLPASNG
jgi:hypothetical protein